MQNLVKFLFIISVIFISISYAYEKGKIDTHGGKGDSLTSGKAFGMAIGIGSVLNKKSSDEEKKDDKNFIPLENSENIEKIEQIKDN